MSEEKKKRLFIMGPGCNETWCYCGGPDPREASNGAAEIVRAGLGDVFEESGEPLEFTFDIREMTDAQVEELGDI